MLIKEANNHKKEILGLQLQIIIIKKPQFFHCFILDMGG